MGRKGILVNLKTTSPEGEVKYFKSIPEIAESLGFSERGVRKLTILREIELVNIN